MHDALVVRRSEALRGLRGVRRRLSRGQWAAPQLVAQSRPLEQLHHGVRRGTFPADVVDREDVGMAERRDDTRLALEARERLLVLGEPLRQHLDRDVALQPGVAGAIDLAHPARADRRQDLVGSQARAGGEGHGRRDYRCAKRLSWRSTRPVRRSSSQRFTRFDLLRRREVAGLEREQQRLLAGDHAVGRVHRGRRAGLVVVAPRVEAGHLHAAREVHDVVVARRWRSARRACASRRGTCAASRPRGRAGSR